MIWKIAFGFVDLANTNDKNYTSDRKLREDISLKVGWAHISSYVVPFPQFAYNAMLQHNHLSQRYPVNPSLSYTEASAIL